MQFKCIKYAWKSPHKEKISAIKIHSRVFVLVVAFTWLLAAGLLLRFFAHYFMVKKKLAKVPRKCLREKRFRINHKYSRKNSTKKLYRNFYFAFFFGVVTMLCLAAQTYKEQHPSCWVDYTWYVKVNVIFRMILLTFVSEKWLSNDNLLGIWIYVSCSRYTLK